MLYGGARSGKTVLFVRAIMMRAIHAPETRHAMLRLRANAARASLWLDTLPKVQRVFFPKFTLRDHRQDGYVEIVESGSQIWIAGTDDKERIEKILGQEFLTIYLNECSQIPDSTVLTVLTRLAQTHPEVMQKAFYDLNPVGTRHYTSMLFVQGRDPLTQIPILDAHQRQYAFINPKDNHAFLTEEFLRSLQAMPDRQRRRFYEGIDEEDADASFFTLSKRKGLPHLSGSARSTIPARSTISRSARRRSWRVSLNRRHSRSGTGWQFSGSGTTIIAAEMTGRVCHAIEIAPAYVDVAVKRCETHCFDGKRF